MRYYEFIAQSVMLDDSNSTVTAYLAFCSQQNTCQFFNQYAGILGFLEHGQFDSTLVKNQLSSNNLFYSSCFFFYVVS